MTTHDNIDRLTPAELQNMGKTELRVACRARRISYAKLTVADMREAVLEWEEARVFAHAPKGSVLARPMRPAWALSACATGSSPQGAKPSGSAR